MRAFWDSDRIMTHLNYLGTIITRQMAELAYRPAWGACYRLGAMIFLVLLLLQTNSHFHLLRAQEASEIRCYSCMGQPRAGGTAQ